MNRFWLDSNLLIRYLTGEPAGQASQVEKFMEQAERGEVRLALDRLIVAEVIWALTSSIYHFSMSDIARDFVPFLSSDHLDVENRELLIDAIELSRDKNVDFIDSYLSLRALQGGDQVCTFDKTDFKKLPAPWRTP